MKKTDLEMFIATYKQFGIDIKTYENNNKEIEVSLHGIYENATESEKFAGYYGCYSDLYFTKDGKFIRQSFWEE